VRTIHKYTVETEDSFTLDMPQGAEVLCVQLQHGVPQIWALVEDDAPRQTRSFAVRGTGHDCGGLSAGQYIGTYQLVEGSFVGHVFEV
jgi:hypothetical protein